MRDLLSGIINLDDHLPSFFLPEDRQAKSIEVEININISVSIPQHRPSIKAKQRKEYSYILMDHSVQFSRYQIYEIHLNWKLKLFIDNHLENLNVFRSIHHFYKFMTLWLQCLHWIQKFVSFVTFWEL